jgi:uncharacterized protein (DUF1501 family)
VVLTLYGGNDGLDTVIPWQDGTYLSARGALAKHDGNVLDLGEGLALHPALTQMNSLWHKGNLAIVRGVGYPNPDRSHFRSMDIWQSAVPDGPSSTGWLGRWLDQLPGDPDPLTAVAVGPQLPRLLSAARRSAAAIDAGSLSLPARPGLTEGFARLVGSPTGLGSLGDAVASSGSDLLSVQSELKAKLGQLPSTPGTKGGAKAAKTGRVATATLTDQLDFVAQGLAAGLPTRVWSVDLGGFDTHAAEAPTRANLLAELDKALGDFVGRVASTPAGSDVVVLVYSEFGRRVAANGSAGTDHGTAGPVFLIGSRVKGGFQGDEPSLTDLDSGDLKMTTDFRSVYAGLLGEVLGAEPDPMLGGQFTPVRVLA